MSTLDAAADLPFAPPRVEIHRIGIEDLNWALAQGWRDFGDKRGDLIFAGLIYPVVCLAAVLTTVNDPLLPLLFPLVAGISIAGPAVASGFYELARRREDGLDASWRHFLDPMKGRSRLPLIELTLLLGALFIGWLAAAYLIYALLFAGQVPLHMADFAGQLFTTAQGWALIVIGNLVGLAFALVTLVVGFVSFPMVVDRQVDSLTALQTSIRAAAANPGVTLGWGLRIAGLLAIGTIPAGVGLAVVLPVLGYATWHLYTRTVAR
jgi:uncharacterized membrane protein